MPLPGPEHCILACSSHHPYQFTTPPLPSADDDDDDDTDVGSGKIDDGDLSGDKDHADGEGEELEREEMMPEKTYVTRKNELQKTRLLSHL